jgi:hypothetical protein
MGILTAVLAVLSIICMALGIVNILGASTEPILNANLTWTFWMAMAGFLMLCTIALLLLGRGRMSGD